MRAGLAEVQAGTLSPELEQNLQTLNTNAAELQAKIASLDTKLEGVQGKAPAQLQDRLANLDERLSDLDGRLTARLGPDRRRARGPAAGERRRPGRRGSPRPRLGSPTLLDRPAVQNPGQLVVLRSGQLDGLQTLVAGAPQPRLRAAAAGPPAVRGRHLPGDRGGAGEALIAAGGGILTATLLVLLTRRLLGGAVVDAVAGSETVKPAIQSVWDIVSGTLRERAIFALVIGVAFVAAGLLAGPARWAVAVRRALAPYLRDQPVGGLLGRRRAVPALADRHARDQQSRTGPGDRVARSAGRGRHRSAAPPDGARVSPAPEWSDPLSEATLEALLVFGREANATETGGTTQ